MVSPIRTLALAIEGGPHASVRRIHEIAAELDRHADWSLKHGRVLIAERASSRALELRQMAGANR